MVRRSRLSRGNGSRRKDRMERSNPGLGGEPEPKVSGYSFGDAELKASMDGDAKELGAGKEHFSLNKIFSEIKKDVTKGSAVLKEVGGAAAKELGGFMHEVIYLDEDEAAAHGKNYEIVQRLMSQHPQENVLLKAVLDEEPSMGTGKVGYVRAEDYLNFQDLEITMPNGKTFTVQRRKIREFIGVAPQSAEISVPMTATAVGGLGTKDMASVDRSVLVPVQAYEEPGDR